MNFANTMTGRFSQRTVDLGNISTFYNVGHAQC